jgi:putative DNA primase/helicase
MSAAEIRELRAVAGNDGGHYAAGAVQDAERLVASCYTLSDGSVTLRRWRGGWYVWTFDRGCYSEISDEALDRVIYRALGKGKRNEVAEVRHALIAVDDVLIDHVDLGTWIGASPAGMSDARDVAACANGLVHLPSGARVPSTPRYFATNVLGVDHRMILVETPTRWLESLAQWFPNDPEAIACLQEMFGYLLTCDTRQQKLFMLIGGRRSGKGTTLRVMDALLGQSVAAPTLASLGTNFGIEPLIGKSAAVIGDARLTGRTDVGQLLERLLSISGEDMQTVDRKHRAHWTGRLSARFVISTNEVPNITDPSGALAGRVILIRFGQSFYGHEDVNLTDKLLDELPGILAWAIEGWRRLRTRGHFMQPRTSVADLEQLEDIGDSVGAWIREACERGPALAVTKSEARASYQAWCARNDVPAKSAPLFGRDLSSKGINVTRPRDASGKQVDHYAGIRLRAA